MRTRHVRKWHQRRVRRSLSAVAVALALSACGGDGGGTEPEPEEAEIEVAVRVDGSGAAGVAVSLYAVGGGSALSTRQTTSSGTVLFGGLEPGTYEVEVEVPEGHELAEGETARQSVTAPAGGRARVEIDLREVDPGIVEIRLTSSLRFEPSSVTISPGTTVRWVNETDMLHTITPDDHSEWDRQELSSDGQLFTHEFTAAGEFPYFCEPHESSGMTGSITVE